MQTLPSRNRSVPTGIDLASSFSLSHARFARTRVEGEGIGWLFGYSVGVEWILPFGASWLVYGLSREGAGCFLSKVARLVLVYVTKVSVVC